MNIYPIILTAMIALAILFFCWATGIVKTSRGSTLLMFFILLIAIGSLVPAIVMECWNYIARRHSIDQIGWTEAAVGLLLVRLATSNPVTYNKTR